MVLWVLVEKYVSHGLVMVFFELGCIPRTEDALADFRFVILRAINPHVELQTNAYYYLIAYFPTF